MVIVGFLDENIEKRPDINCWVWHEVSRVNCSSLCTCEPCGSWSDWMRQAEVVITGMTYIGYYDLHPILTILNQLFLLFYQRRWQSEGLIFMISRKNEMLLKKSTGVQYWAHWTICDVPSNSIRKERFDPSIFWLQCTVLYLYNDALVFQWPFNWKMAWWSFLKFNEKKRSFCCCSWEID